MSVSIVEPYSEALGRQSLGDIVTKFLSVILVLFLSLSGFSAEAKRLGGGKSTGQQSNNVTQRETVKPGAPAQQAAPAGVAKPAVPPAAPARPWGAMLGGLAAGLGLAWLANSMGLGGAMGNILMFALIAFAAMALIGWFIRSRKSAGKGGLAYQGSGASPASPEVLRNYNPEKVGNDASARPWEANNTRFDSAAPAATGSMIGSALGAGGGQNWGVPAGFDSESFLAAAKQNFATLQDAWDRSDISMLRSMMTDNMLNEIRAQLAEREATASGQPNKTEVLMLEAQLLGIEELPDVYMASVEFNGMIREEANASPSPFREVWNMTKPRQGGSGWLVSGVQALQ
jgi:predicted lipid-binding transport protein (Tim44 family)